MQPEQGPAYHERQRLHQCLRHSLNNVFQSSQFSSRELDAIADSLAPGRPPLPFLHPHRTLLMGNYDVNVLEVALRRHGKELRWHDLRDTAFERLDLRAAWALILNVQSHSTVGRLVGGRHWLALRRFGGHWWNLDSNLLAPRLVADCCCGTASEAPSHLEAAAGRGSAGQAAAAAAAAGDCSTAHGDEAEGAVPSVAADRDAAAAAAAAAAAEPRRATAAGSDDSAAGQEAQQASGSAAAAADDAAVRRFLAEQVQRHDAKVFVVVDSPIQSHPLQDSPQQPPAADA